MGQFTLCRNKGEDMKHNEAFTIYLREWRAHGRSQDEVDFVEFMTNIKEMVKCEVCLGWFEYGEYELVVDEDGYDERYWCDNCYEGEG